MKKAAFIASVIPTVSIAGTDSIDDRLYGEPTSIKPKAYAKEIYQADKLRLNFTQQHKDHVEVLSQIGNKILLDEEIRSRFLIDEAEFFKSISVNYEEIKDLEALKILRLFAQDNFRDAMLNRDYRNVIIELQSHGFLGSDDLSRLKDNFKLIFDQDAGAQQALIKDVKLLQDQRLNLENMQNLSMTDVRPNYVCTAFSFCLAVANVGAVSNAVAVAVAVAWCGAYAWGCGSTSIEGVSEEGFYLGKLALNDDKLRDNKMVAFKVAEAIGSEHLVKEVNLDIIHSEIFAYYDAAYEVGLIPTEEDRDLLVKGVLAHIKASYVEAPTSAQ